MTRRTNMLDTNQKEEILEKICELFSDVLADRIDDAELYQSNGTYIQGQTHRTYLEGQIARLSEMNITKATIQEVEKDPANWGLLLSCVCVLIAAQGELGRHIMAKTEDDFFLRNPNCERLPVTMSSETCKLFRYWQYMLVCLTILPALYNKRRILDICGRLEGTQGIYTTGSCACGATLERVRIYELEGNIKPEDRSNRTRAAPECQNRDYGQAPLPHRNDPSNKKKRVRKSESPEEKKRKQEVKLERYYKGEFKCSKAPRGRKARSLKAGHHPTDPSNKKRRARMPEAPEKKKRKQEVKLERYYEGEFQPSETSRRRTASQNTGQAQRTPIATVSDVDSESGGVIDDDVHASGGSEDEVGAQGVFPVECQSFVTHPAPLFWPEPAAVLLLQTEAADLDPHTVADVNYEAFSTQAFDMSLYSHLEFLNLFFEDEQDIALDIGGCLC